MKWFISLLNRFQRLVKQAHQNQGPDQSVASTCNAINGKILETAERIITNHQKDLLGNSVDYVIGAVWASSSDKLTDLQKDIHEEITTSLNDIWAMVDLKELIDSKRLLFIYLVQTLVVYVLAYMTANLKISSGYGPTLKNMPLDKMEPLGRA